MLYLVKDILDFSQLEAKSFILNYSLVNVVKLLNDCIDVFTYKADDKGIQLLNNYYKRNIVELPTEINTDENRLKQIIINLVSNAIKYTEKGG